MGIVEGGIDRLPTGGHVHLRRVDCTCEDGPCGWGHFATVGGPCACSEGEYELNGAYDFCEPPDAFTRRTIDEFLRRVAPGKTIEQIREERGPAPRGGNR